MLKIKKAHKQREEWILYNPDNLKLHTHCGSLRVALTIKRNVLKRRIPESNNLRMLQSHLRVTKDKNYISALQRRIDEIKAAEYERKNKQNHN